MQPHSASKNAVLAVTLNESQNGSAPLFISPQWFNHTSTRFFKLKLRQNKLMILWSLKLPYFFISARVNIAYHAHLTSELDCQHK